MLTPTCKKVYLPFVIKWIRDSFLIQAPIHFASEMYQGRSRTSLIRLCNVFDTSLIPKNIEYAAEDKRVLPGKSLLYISL